MGVSRIERIANAGTLYILLGGAQVFKVVSLP